MKIERCCDCDEPTGKAGAGDGSLFQGAYGPLCDKCFDEWPDKMTAEVARLKGIIRNHKVAERVPEWQPIETAPNNELILIGPTKRMGVCVGMNHSFEGWVTETPSDWVSIYAPTHWMPLPAAPKKEGE